MTIVNFFFSTRTTDPNDAFRERAIRVILPIALIFFVILHISDILEFGMSALFFYWYMFIYSIVALIFTALSFQKIEAAVRLIIPAMLLTLFDPTAAYWSPGTVLLGIMFTFLFQLLIHNQYERTGAIIINLGIYTYLALSVAYTSPLATGDYFSSPITAILTVFMAHLILIAVIHFVREQQKLRNQQTLILEQQRVEVLQQFLGHSSHDLRTLLTRLSNGLYIAKKKLDVTEQTALNRLEDASQDLEKVVLSMLEIAKLHDDSHLAHTKLAVDQIIQTVIGIHEHHAQEKSIRIAFNSQTTFSHIHADAQYIQRALGNILENAIIYSPENSTIEVTTYTKRKHVIINITDEGIGIEADHLPYIFDSFFRADEARNQSTGLNGLGLSITKKIIELHHGTVSVTSEVGVGSIFTVKLPMD